MSNGLISLALSRQKDRPDIHKTVIRPRNGDAYKQDYVAMVLDLKSHVPGLSQRQLSTLIGVSARLVRRALDCSVPVVEWSQEDNEASSAAHLYALQCAHPNRSYEEIADIDCDRHGAFAVASVPDQHGPASRKADQSHTVKRPITLATSPYSVAA